MTAQRALRELQNQGLIYGVPARAASSPRRQRQLFPEPVEIRNEDEYKAMRDTFVAAMDASNAALEAAIASEDIEAIKAAKAYGDQVLTEQYANMLGMTTTATARAIRTSTPRRPPTGPKPPPRPPPARPNATSRSTVDRSPQARRAGDPATA